MDRRRIYTIIQVGNLSDTPSRAYDIFLILAVAVNIFIAIFDTFPQSEAYASLIWWIECLTVIFFAIDYVLRIWTADLLYDEMTPAGYLSIQPEGEHVFHLQKIYVLPSFQGMKLGKLLFEQAIRAIKELHPLPCQMRLNVNRQNKALTFYQKMGMTKVDEGDFPIGHGFYMNDYIMGLDI